MGHATYREWLLAEGLESSTVVNYRGKIAKVEALVCEQGWDMCDLTASQLRWISAQFPQSRSTLMQLKAALSHYCNMLGSPAPLRAIKLPKRHGEEEYKGLEDDEAHRLEAVACRHTCNGGLAALMGLYLALRRTEIAQLRWDDFDRKLGWVDVLGKGSRRRWLPLHPTLRRVLEPGDGYVFPGQGRTGHVHAGTIYNWIGDLCAEADVSENRRNPHALRHTCLTRLYEETGDVRLVQRFAGHADPATTAKYTRVPARMLEAAVVGLNYRIT